MGRGEVEVTFLGAAMAFCRVGVSGGRDELIWGRSWCPSVSQQVSQRDWAQLKVHPPLGDGAVAQGWAKSLLRDYFYNLFVFTCD